MARLALLVGIDDYPGSPLSGCVADAHAMEGLLARHADGSANFQTRTLTSDKTSITRPTLRQAVQQLFEKNDADASVLFFAGHGAKNDAGGYLVTQDGRENDEGVPMVDIIGFANRCKARERIIILDCCHAGAIDSLVAAVGPVPLEEGVSILAACRPTEYAKESAGRGLFSSLICEALEGGAADVRGFVTIAGAYGYVNEVLTGWDQRPLFRASLSKVGVLRRAASSISDEKLRLLTEYFPSPHDNLPLDPSYEPTAKPENERHEKIFSHLQQLRAARLVEPVGTEHLYFAAMQSLACRLTPLGRFYWRAVEANKI